LLIIDIFYLALNDGSTSAEHKPNSRSKQSVGDTSRSVSVFIEPLLGALTDSGMLVYPMVIVGRVSIEEVRRIMGEAEQLHYAVEPPVKDVLCRASSLPEVMSKTLC
jgi:hypothetical protein